jgi:hypothetical protein
MEQAYDEENIREKKGLMQSFTEKCSYVMHQRPLHRSLLSMFFKISLKLKNEPDQS